jgi:hypothetical protein
VIQSTNGGINRSTGSEDESQTQNATTAGALTQNKIGPEFCCTEQIGGTTANVNVVTQVSTQNDNEGPGANQQSQQDGQCSQTVAGATCTVDQTYTENGTTDHETNTGMEVSNDRFCTGGVEGGCFVD